MATGKYYRKNLIKLVPKVKPVVYSSLYNRGYKRLLSYTNEKFGVYPALSLANDIRKKTAVLPYCYLTHSECRFIPTKSKMYRTIVVKKFASILYRIKPTRIEVLSIYDNSISPSRISKMRSIKI